MKKKKKLKKSKIDVYKISLMVILISVSFISFFSFDGYVKTLKVNFEKEFFNPESLLIESYPSSNLQNTATTIIESQKPKTSAKLLYFGDTALLEPLGSWAVADPNFDPFSNVKEFFSEYDYISGDLEGTIDGASVGSPNEGKAYTFSMPKDSVRVFKNAGIDSFNYANNHTRDFGPNSVIHTIDLLKQEGIGVYGAGANESEAFKPLVVEINGNKIAFLAFNSAEYAYNIAVGDTPGTASFIEYKVRDAISYARTVADIVIVIPHWGDEHVTTPNDLELTWANIFTSAGADIVIGGHPHVRQAPATVNGKPVIYSLGNFMFPGQAWDPEAQLGWAIEINVKNKKIVDYKLHDIQMDANGVPSLVSQK